jgi:hypothetical protein
VKLTEGVEHPSPRIHVGPLLQRLDGHPSSSDGLQRIQMFTPGYLPLDALYEFPRAASTDDFR